ncbi:MAG: heparan-alpha-glucosaminide N-acetyltransferase domain-containing protein, partial [Bacteroidota bacterium]
MKNNSMGKSGLSRFGELDFLRGIAVISMVVFHGYEDFSLLKSGRPLEGVIFNLWQQETAILFLALFGVGAYLNYTRHGSGIKAGFLRRLRKGALLFGWGMLITFTTFLFLREGFVTFGILHLMGVSSVLIFPLL